MFKDAIHQKATVISLDESYFSERVLPLYGYSAVGSKCVVASPVPAWRQRSLLLAIASDGTAVQSLKHGSFNKAAITKFLAELPYPRGSVVLLDNASIHNGVHLVAVAKGYKVCFTPPYSPEFNPVEHAFSKIKACFRGMWPWAGGSAVDESVQAATETLSSADILGYFRAVSARVAEASRGGLAARV